MYPLYYNTRYWLAKHEWPFHFQQCKQIHSLPRNMLEAQQLLDINFKLSSPQVLRHDSNTKFVSFMEVSVRPLLHKTWLKVKLCNQASMFHKFYDCTAGSSKLMWEFTAWDKKIGMTINIHTPHGHRLEAFVAFRCNVMRCKNWPEDLATNSRHCQPVNRFLNLPARRGSCSMNDWIHPMYTNKQHYVTTTKSASCPSNHRKRWTAMDDQISGLNCTSSLQLLMH